MTEDDANAALLVMVIFDQRDWYWTDDRLEAWKHAIGQCADPQAALEASDALVADADPRDWSLHRWREAYQDALRRRDSRRQLAEKAFTPVPPERVRQLLAESIEQGRAERLARAEQGDPVILARLSWWRDGAKGHYPGCDCKRCAAGLRPSVETSDHRLLFDAGFPAPLPAEESW